MMALVIVTQARNEQGPEPMKSTIWCVMPCSLVEVHEHYGEYPTTSRVKG
jgi:hypothetical protein